MRPQSLVVLLGDTVLIDSVAAGLEDTQAFGVVRMDASVDGLGEHLKALNPALIVFELDTRRSPAIFSLLREQPGTQLLGLDLTCSQAIVLKSCQHTTRTMKELCQVVQAEVDHRAQTRKGGDGREKMNQ
jgi:hypothetical protein